MKNWNTYRNTRFWSRSKEISSIINTLHETLIETLDLFTNFNHNKNAQKKCNYTTNKIDVITVTLIKIESLKNLIGPKIAITKRQWPKRFFGWNQRCSVFIYYLNRLSINSVCVGLTYLNEQIKIKRRRNKKKVSKP